MYKSNQIIRVIIILTISWWCTVINAHEFWIEPEKFTVKSNEEIIGNLKIGEMMKGVSYGYYPRNFKRFELRVKNIFSPITGRIGDKPAIKIPAQGDNLVTLIHSTTDNIVQYNDWLKFNKFLHEKDLVRAKKEHINQKFPKSKFIEIYSRYTKSLIGSGRSLGKDQKVGLEFEIVLTENPYADDIGEELTILLFYKNHPKADTQIEIFTRAEDQVVTRETTKTNELGKARIKVSSKTDYLINSVIIRQPEPDKASTKVSEVPVLWESLWASSTFTVP